MCNNVRQNILMRYNNENVGRMRYWLRCCEPMTEALGDIFRGIGLVHFTSYINVIRFSQHESNQVTSVLGIQIPKARIYVNEAQSYTWNGKKRLDYA